MYYIFVPSDIIAIIGLVLRPAELNKRQTSINMNRRKVGNDGRAAA